MAIIKSKYNVNNGTTWDTHHYETSADMVMLNNGKNLVEEFNSMIFGGKNLLLDSTGITFYQNDVGLGTSTNMSNEKEPYKRLSNTGTNKSIFVYTIINTDTHLATPLKLGKAYSHSIDIRVNSPNSTEKITYYVRGTGDKLVKQQNFIVKSNEWTRLKIEGIIYDNSFSNYLTRIIYHLQLYNWGITLDYKNPMVEESNVAHDGQPCWLDFHNKIEALETIMSIENFNLGIPSTVRKLAGVAKKQNKSVSLEGFVCQYVTASSNGFVSGDRIATVPPGYRPTTEIRVYGAVGRMGSYSNTIGTVVLQTNGDIIVNLALDSTAFNNVYFSASYLI